VNDALLDSKFPQNNFVKRSYRAFPVAYLPAAVSGTYVGVGHNYKGSGNTPLSSNSMEYYLTDGIRGFDLGTGVYNLPRTGAGTSNQSSKYTVTQITPSNLNEPVVVISQMGQPGCSSSEDVFYFVDERGQVVGDKKSVAFSGINGVGWGHFKFYSVGANSLNYVTSPAGACAD